MSGKEVLVLKKLKLLRILDSRTWRNAQARRVAPTLFGNYYG